MICAMQFVSKVCTEFLGVAIPLDIKKNTTNNSP